MLWAIACHCKLGRSPILLIMLTGNPEFSGLSSTPMQGRLLDNQLPSKRFASGEACIDILRVLSNAVFIGIL